jgi:hypothetical protein
MCNCSGRRDRTAFDESLVAAQRAKQSEAGTQLAQMAARQASGKGPLAGTDPRSSGRGGAVTTIDERLVEAAWEDPPTNACRSQEAEMRAKQATLKRRIADSTDVSMSSFRSSDRCSSQQPVSRAQIRSVLKSREALIGLSDE